MSVFSWLKDKYRKLDQATQPIQNRVVSQIKQTLPTPTNFNRQVVQPIQRTGIPKRINLGFTKSFNDTLGSFNRITNAVQPKIQNYVNKQTIGRNQFNAQHPTLTKINAPGMAVGKFTAGMPKAIVRAGARSAGQIYNTIRNKPTFTPQGSFAKLVYGSDQVGDVQNRIQTDTDWAERKGLKGNTAKLAGISLAIPALVGDVIPIGGGKKKAGEEGLSAISKLKIPASAKNEMAYFIDAVRDAVRTGKLPSENEYKYFNQLAKDYNIPVGNFNGNMAEAFDDTLRRTATKGREFIRKGKGGGNRYAGSRSVRTVVPKITGQANNPMYGGVAGVEIKKDENGKLKIGFNPTKALAGMAVMGGVKYVGKGKLPKPGEVVSNGASKYKSAEEFKSSMFGKNFTNDKYLNFIDNYEKLTGKRVGFADTPNMTKQEWRTKVLDPAITDFYNKSKPGVGEVGGVKPPINLTKPTTKNVSVKETGFVKTGQNVPIKKDQPFVLPQNIGTTRKLMRVLTSGGAELKRMGESGGKLAKTIKLQTRDQDIVSGQWTVKLQDAMKGLNENERKLAGQVREGLAQSNDPRIITAANKLKSLLDEIGTNAQNMGLKIKLPNGQSVPFKLRENYMPRSYDFNELQKAGHRQKLLQHLVDSGQAQNLADASNIFDNFIKNNTVRTAGNLEHARVLDLPGYELDPTKSVGKYIDSASRRLTETQYYGSTDELAKTYIERIRREGGDEKYAQEVFDLMTGQKQYKNVGVDLATKFNYITKLDLGFITNATQPINTAVKTGIINTIGGILKAYTSPYVSGRYARQVGAVTDNLISKGAGEGVTMGRIMETVLKPFSFVEKKNRVGAAIAGKNYAQQMADRLLKNPNSKLAIRQLKSIGIDPEKIIAQGKILPEDILLGAKGTSDVTQFKVNAIDIPPGWKTNIGRLLSQFKSFSFKQTIFIRDEVIKEAAAGNVMPLVKLIALGVPASFVAQSVRNKLTGRNPSEEEKSLDIRKLDMYTKAIGSIPTDLITQGKFLADTYKNPYATPLKKIGRTISSVAGPTVGEAFNLINAVEQAGAISKTNDMYNQNKDAYLEAKRIVSGYIPFVGEQIKNKVFAYPKTYATGNESVGKQLSDQIKQYKQGKKVGDSPIAQMADGRWAYRIGENREYADTQEKAQLGLDKEVFKKSGKNFQVQGDNVFRLSKDGDITVKTKISYDTLLTTQKLENAKTAKNLNEWFKLADQQEKNILTQLEDPSLDELEKMELQQKYDKLVADAEKYGGYGGFTKPKKGKKGKKAKKIKLTAPKLTSLTVKVPAAKKPTIKLTTMQRSSGGQQTGKSPRAIRAKRMF